MRSGSLTPNVVAPSSKGIIPNPPTPPSQKIISLSASNTDKVEPFYVSLLVREYVLKNCIIDSGAFDNVMSIKIAKALKLTMTPNSGSCYTMESKKVPILWKVNDAHVDLARFTDKKVLAMILVAYILASFGILLRRGFMQQLGGKIKINWSFATIPVKGDMEKFLPEKKMRYTV